jgi:hypothetical protein
MNTLQKYRHKTDRPISGSPDFHYKEPKKENPMLHLGEQSIHTQIFRQLPVLFTVARGFLKKIARILNDRRQNCCRIGKGTYTIGERLHKVKYMHRQKHINMLLKSNLK